MARFGHHTPENSQTLYYTTPLGLSYMSISLHEAQAKHLTTP